MKLTKKIVFYNLKTLKDVCNGITLVIKLCETVKI